MSIDTKQRCELNFSTYSIDGNNYDEYFKLIKKIKGKEFKSLPFFPKIGNYINDYKEDYKKYSTCNDKYRTNNKYGYKISTSKCEKLLNKTNNSKKILFTQLSKYSKKKTLKRINKVKNKKILKELSCYMKLLDDLVNVKNCGIDHYSTRKDHYSTRKDHYSTRKDNYITVLKNEIEKITSEKDKSSAVNYIGSLLSDTSDLSESDTFKTSDKDFKEALSTIIERYQTC
jgi:hypothetical protein